MGRYKRGKDKEIIGKFVPLTFQILDSEAYKALSTNAAWVYNQMERKHIQAKYSKNKKDPSRLILTYREVRYKFKSDDTFYKARSEVFEYGFFEIVEQGGRGHKPTIFKPSFLWLSLSVQMKEEKDRKAQSERDKARYQEKQQLSEEEALELLMP